MQEQPTFDKKQFVAYMKKYIKQITPRLEPEKQELFKKHIEGATKCLLSKLDDLQLYAFFIRSPRLVIRVVSAYAPF